MYWPHFDLHIISTKHHSHGRRFCFVIIIFSINLIFAACYSSYYIKSRKLVCVSEIVGFIENSKNKIYLEFV